MNVKSLLVVVVVFGAVLGMAVFGGNAVIGKITDRVVEQLKKDYSPGPYSPGFDPDKVSPDFFSMQPQTHQQQVQPQYGFGPPSQVVPFIEQTQPNLGNPTDWNKQWEQQRL